MPRCPCGSLQAHQIRHRAFVKAVDVDEALVFMAEHGTARLDITDGKQMLIWRSCVLYGLHRQRAEGNYDLRLRRESREFLAEWARNIHAAKVAKQAERAAGLAR